MTTHRMSKSRIYKIWSDIKRRCYNPHSKGFKNYGGRGIIVCNEWLNNFKQFYEDMGPSYEEHVRQFGEAQTTIDRINFDGNYCKENCRWATRFEQARNKRKYKGRREKKYGLSEKELAKKCGVSYGSFRYQLRIHFKGDMESLLSKYNYSL